MKSGYLTNPVRMRSSAVAMALRRAAEWVDSSTSHSMGDSARAHWPSLSVFASDWCPAGSCYFRRCVLTVPSCFFFLLDLFPETPARMKNWWFPERWKSEPAHEEGIWLSSRWAIHGLKPWTGLWISRRVNVNLLTALEFDNRIK